MLAHSTQYPSLKFASISTLPFESFKAASTDHAFLQTDETTVSVAEVDSAATATYSTTSATIPSIPETLTPDFNEAAASMIASTHVAEASFGGTVSTENANGAIANPEFPARHSSPMMARIVKIHSVVPHRSSFFLSSPSSSSFSEAATEAASGASSLTHPSRKLTAWISPSTLPANDWPLEKYGQQQQQQRQSTMTLKDHG